MAPLSPLPLASPPAPSPEPSPRGQRPGTAPVAASPLAPMPTAMVAPSMPMAAPSSAMTATPMPMAATPMPMAATPMPMAAAPMPIADLPSAPHARPAQPAARRVRTGVAALVLTGLLLAAMALAAGIGAVHIAPREIGALLLRPLGLGHAAVDAQAAAVFWLVRLPRVLLATLVGAALATTGAATQGLFRNPLADPTLLGVSSGAALAAVIGIVVGPRLGAHLAPGWGPFILPLAAFAGALASTQLSLLLARRAGAAPVLLLLLAGIAVNAMCSAGTGLVVQVANDAELRSIVFWTLGSLGGATWTLLAGVAPFLLLSLIGLGREAPALDLLLLGEAEAQHAGVAVRAVRRRVVMLVALGVGAAVAACGIIVFVGLVVPHLVRLAVGPTHRRLLLLTAPLGALLLVVADLLARTVVAPVELPIGVVTSLAGAPLFLWLLVRDREARRC